MFYQSDHYMGVFLKQDVQLNLQLDKYSLIKNPPNLKTGLILFSLMNMTLKGKRLYYLSIQSFTETIYSLKLSVQINKVRKQIKLLTNSC